MNTDIIYTVIKGEERVSVADKQSALDLLHALAVVECTEAMGFKKLSGNRQSLPVYDTAFLDVHINVVTLQDVEKVLHWMLGFGCNTISVNKITEIKEEETNE